MQTHVDRSIGKRRAFAKRRRIARVELAFEKDMVEFKDTLDYEKSTWHDDVLPAALKPAPFKPQPP